MATNMATCCPMATNMATCFFSKMDQPLFTGQQNDVEPSVKHGICTKIWFSCRRPVLFAPKSGATRTTFESEDGGGKVKCQTSFDMLSQNRWRRCITVTWVVICQGCSYFNATSIYNSRPPDTWLGFCLIHNSLIWFLKTIDYSWFSCLGLVGIYLDIDDISWWHKIQRLCIAQNKSTTALIRFSVCM